MWKFQDFSVIQILREINFGHFEATKTAILTISEALNFEFLTLSSEKFFQISKLKASKLPKYAKNDFM